MKVRLNDYDPKDVMRIIREWADLDRNTFGKTINKSGKTIKNYENGVNSYNILLLKEIAKKHGLIVTIEKKQ